MTNARQKLGRLGEEAALAFLESRGMRLFKRNYRIRSGEIDLIMWENDTLVFVEVRTKSHETFGTPAETIVRQKRRKIENTARQFLKSFRISDEIRCRFDVVGVVFEENNECRVNYIENAFLAGE
ncbi:MAG: YraN family protein [Candidatus Rifleibacteriota bacterium]